MLIDPASLKNNLDRLEEIEKASLRLVAQAVFDFRREAAEIFRMESDLAQDIGEDLTREALDRMGVSRVDQRLFGKIDYKRARYVFHPDYALKQALFVDSKAEKDAEAVARVQTTQLSMMVMQIRKGQPVKVQGELPPVIKLDKQSFLTTTLFVKYHYEAANNANRLKGITLAAVPNGMLQALYNPSPEDTIFTAGPNAPSRGEKFRTRLSFARLKAKKRWRIQKIALSDEQLNWED